MNGILAFGAIAVAVVIFAYLIGDAPKVLESDKSRIEFGEMTIKPAPAAMTVRPTSGGGMVCPPGEHLSSGKGQPICRKN